MKASGSDPLGPCIRQFRMTIAEFPPYGSYLLQSGLRMMSDKNGNRLDPMGSNVEIVGCLRYRRAPMRYKPKSIAALQLALGGLPTQMRVEVESGIEVKAKTVGDLRKVSAWPENLAITTPQDRYPESAVRVSKANVATRTSPKS
jgi:hypothetical protein